MRTSSRRQRIPTRPSSPSSRTGEGRHEIPDDRCNLPSSPACEERSGWERVASAVRLRSRQALRLRWPPQPCPSPVDAREGTSREHMPPAEIKISKNGGKNGAMPSSLCCPCSQGQVGATPRLRSGCMAFYSLLRVEWGRHSLNTYRIVPANCWSMNYSYFTFDLLS